MWNSTKGLIYGYSTRILETTYTSIVIPAIINKDRKWGSKINIENIKSNLKSLQIDARVKLMGVTIFSQFMHNWWSFLNSHFHIY